VKRIEDMSEGICSDLRGKWKEVEVVWIEEY